MKRIRALNWVVGLVACVGVGRAQVITTVVGTDWTFPASPLPAIHAPLGSPGSVAVGAGGNVYATDGDNNFVVRIAPDGSLSVIAGNGLVGYSGDGGPALSASFEFLSGIAVDSAGDVYVSDYYAHVVRKVTAAGTITTVAGNGTAGYSGDGGPGTSAELYSPAGLAVDSVGNLYIADPTEHVVRKLAPDGTITTAAGNGTAGDSGDGGPATSARLAFPNDVAMDAAGNLYIADGSAIRKVKPDGTIVTVKEFVGAPPLAVDSAGNVFIVVDPNVLRLAPSGVLTTVAGNGQPGYSGDGGPATAAQIAGGATGLAVDAAGDLYIADSENRRIRKVSAAGIISTLAGNGGFRFSGDGGPAASSVLNSPTGVAVDAAGDLLIADNGNNRVRKVTPGGTITTVAGNGAIGPLPQGFQGPATSASLGGPQSVAADSSGDIFVAGGYRGFPLGGYLGEVNSAGMFLTLAANSSIESYAGVAVSGTGGVYVSEPYICVCVQIVYPDGKVTTVAGNGNYGFSGDGGPATSAALSGPGGLALDGAGNLYIADVGYGRIRKVTPSGIITTVVSCIEDGFTGMFDCLYGPQAVAVDSQGSLYIADTGNDVVRKLTPDGITTTVAGNGIQCGGVVLNCRNNGFSGDGGPATSAVLNGPSGVAVDGAGNIFIADTGNNRVREVLAQAPTAQVSPAQLLFRAPSGGAPTHPQQVAFTASVAGLPFTIQLPSNSPWLQVSPLTGVSPRLIAVSANPTNLSPGTYSATVTINSPNGSPASSQVLVTFTVTAGMPPVLALDKQNLSFPFPLNGSARSQTIKVSNSGGGTLSFTASAATSAGGNWLSVLPANGQALPAAPVTLTVTADPSGLAAGTYRGSVTVSEVVVPVTMTISSNPQAILLSQAGLSFLGVSQGGVLPPQSFGVLNIGTGVVNWTVSTSTLSGGGDWLQVTPSSGSTDASAASVPTVQVSANAASLPAGQYYGLVTVTAPNAANSPQVLVVFLEVLAPNTPTGAVLQPSELQFTATAGAESPGSQNVLVYNVAAAAKSFQTSVAADPGLNLVILPTNATLDPQQPTNIVVQPFTSSLAAGVYNGTITLEFSDGRVLTVNVQVIVSAAGTGSATTAKLHAEDATPCTPSKLLPALTTLGQSFAVSAGWPVALSVNVMDDCGTPLEAGSVSVSFSDGETPVVLQSLKGGQWAGTWPTTNSVAAVTLTLQAQDAQRQLMGKRDVSGALQSKTDRPAFPQAGIVNAFGGHSYVPLAPGTIISVYGTRLAESNLGASATPLGTELVDTEVFMAGKKLPLFYVSDLQVNAIVPAGLNVNTTHQVLVQRGSTYSLPVQVEVAAAQPVIYPVITAYPADHSAPHQVSAVNPAHAGDVLVMYAAGLGLTNPALPDGQAAPADGKPLYLTSNTVGVSFGNQTATPFFMGLAPGYVGLYQVNVTVPQGAAGSAVPLTVTVAGQTSPAVPLPIQ